MRVALVTEGTYPFVQGGVTTWCDQVVRSAGSLQFDVLAITALQRVSLAQPLPDNVRRVTVIPLWGSHQRNRLVTPPRIQRRFLEAWERLVYAAAHESEPQAHVAAWKEIARPEVAKRIRGMLESRQATDIAMTTFRDAGHRFSLNVGGTVRALELLRHQLVPLATTAKNVDLTHATGNGLPVLVALATKWRLGTPFLLSEHGVYLRERLLAVGSHDLPIGARAFTASMLRSLVSVGYAEASLIAPGNLYNRRWEEHLGAHPDSIVTAYNGVDPQRFPVATTEPEVPTLVALGRVDPLKDLETLIRSFRIVLDRIPQARLRMFGPVPKGNEEYAQRCSSLISDLGLEGAATFDGMVDEGYTAYHSGHVTMLSSISEGFPYSVLESLSCQRPLVATAVGGVPEAVGSSGRIVPARDPEAMAAAAIELLSDHGMRRRMGRDGRQRVLEGFTLQHASRTVLDLYERAAAAVTLDELATSRPNIVVNYSTRPHAPLSHSPVASLLSSAVSEIDSRRPEPPSRPATGPSV